MDFTNKELYIIAFLAVILIIIMCIILIIKCCIFKMTSYIKFNNNDVEKQIEITAMSNNDKDKCNKKIVKVRKDFIDMYNGNFNDLEYKDSIYF